MVPFIAIKLSRIYFIVLHLVDKSTLHESRRVGSPTTKNYELTLSLMVMMVLFALSYIM